MSLKSLIIMMGVALLGNMVWAVSLTHADKAVLCHSKETQTQQLSCFCLDQNENILVCDERENCIRVITPGDKLLSKWELEFSPQAIACRSNGTVIVAGPGRVSLLTPTGQALASATLPTPPLPVVKGKKLSKAELQARMNYACAATAACSMGDDIFVCARGNTGYTVYRMDSRLEGITPIIKGLSGCCGQMDVAARDGTIYVAANGRSQIVKYNREGKQTGSFGKDSANRDSYFNGCCEPKNVCIGSDGSVYAAESAQCCVNRFSQDGALLDRVGVVKGVTGCVRVTVAVTRDTSRVYMLDTDHNTIHVLERTTATR